MKVVKHKRPLGQIKSHVTLHNTLDLIPKAVLKTTYVRAIFSWSVLKHGKDPLLKGSQSAHFLGANK